MNNNSLVRLVLPLDRTKVIAGRLSFSGRHRGTRWEITLADFPVGREIFSKQGFSDYDAERTPVLTEALSVFPSSGRKSMVSKLLGAPFPPTSIVWIDIHFPQRVLKSVDPIKKALEVDQVSTEIKSMLLLTLRLMYSGECWSDRTIFFNGMEGVADCYGIDVKVCSFGEETVISDENAKSVESLMHSLLMLYGKKKTQYQRVMNIALSFFFSSFYHTGWTHRFMDLAIAVEASFKGRDGSLSKAIPRLAKLIANTKKEAERIEQSMAGNTKSGFFSIRHCIMHGDSSLTDQRPIQAIEKNRHFIKRAIRSLVENQRDLETADDYYVGLEQLVTSRFNTLK